MSLTYTRKQIRTRVGTLTRDTGDSAVSETAKNRIISDVHREFVEATHCNRNTVIFSLADGTSDGTLEYDKHSADRLTGNDPTLTYFDYEGFPWYKLSNCDHIISIERFVADGDGANTVLMPVDYEDINRQGLLDGTTDYPGWYQMDGANSFRMLKELATTAYTIKIRIVYMEAVIDLVSNDDMPTDTTDPPMTTGVGKDDMNIESAGTVAAYWEFEIDAEGTPDTFKHRKDGGTWTTGVNCSTSAVTISDGLTVSWDDNTGHTLADAWTVYQDDPQVGNIPLKYRKAVVYGAVAECFAVRGDERAMLYFGRYEREIERCKTTVYTDTYDKPYVIKRRYGGAGR